MSNRETYPTSNPLLYNSKRVILNSKFDIYKLFLKLKNESKNKL